FAAEVASQTNPGCTDRCGSLEIPYPFGISDGCLLDESFLITCNTTFSPPKPFLGQGNASAPVLNISLDGELRVSSSIARQCYNASGLIVEDRSSRLVLTKFPISNTRNRFTVVGCDTFAAIARTRGQNFTTGCLSLCDQIDNVANGSCAGIGCCQTMIPRGMRNFGAAVGSLENHTTVSSFNPCSFAFLVEEGFYNFSTADLIDLRNKDDMPVVLDWAVGNVTCQEAQNNLTTYACQAADSECSNSSNGPGYRCRCKTGFQGNAYLVDGCQDIDECRTSNPCSGACHNSPGSVFFSCPEGFEGDGMRNGTGCHRKANTGDEKRLIIPLSVTISLLVLIVGGCWIYWGVQKRKLIKLKEKFFEQNGGVMLQQQLSKHKGSIESARIYTAEELKKATKNYHESRVLGQGGYGTVYKGLFPDNKVVAIKKSKICDQSQIEQFINETIYTMNSQHPHFVWELRLKVAAETAGALAYSHSATSMPIIHRNVKTTNILLDNSYTAKVSDFGASRLVPLDQTQLTTLVQGTLGYLDPEYFHSSQLTEKGDVYSFGVVLAELLTGKQALAFDRPEKERNLAMVFVSSMKEDQLLEILDGRIANKRNIQQIQQVAELAKRCLSVRGEERPTMKEVATALEGLRVVEKHPWVKVDLGSEETERT
ncbi:Protein kinase domain - like 10, partial [Theobroma cacao]